MKNIININELDLLNIEKFLVTSINETSKIDIILQFLNSSRYKLAINETTDTGDGDPIDDGTGFLFGDKQSFVNFSKKNYEVFGMKILDYMIDSDDQMNFSMHKNTGMYDATQVTNFPKGNKSDYSQITTTDYEI